MAAGGATVIAAPTAAAAAATVALTVLVLVVFLAFGAAVMRCGLLFTRGAFRRAVGIESFQQGLAHSVVMLCFALLCSSLLPWSSLKPS